MAKSPEEAQRASIKAALDRVGSLDPADPPEGLRKPEGIRGPDGIRAPEGVRGPDGIRAPEGLRKPDGIRGPQQGFVSPATTGPRQPTSVIPPSPQQPAAPPAPPKFGPGPIPPAPGPTNTNPYADKVKSPQGAAFQAEDAARRAKDFNPQPRPQPQGFTQRAADLGRRAADLGKQALDSPLGRRAAPIVRFAGRMSGPVTAAVSAVGSLKEDSTARYAKRFGMDEPTGDGSVGDIAKFAGLRALGYASDVGSTMTLGLADKLYRDRQAPGGASPSGPPSQIRGVDRLPQVYDATGKATQSQVRASKPQEPAAPDNMITVRNGNEFSGENIREGFGYEGTLRRMPGEYGLTSMPADNFASVSPALDRQRAEAMAQLTPAQAAAALGDPGYSRGATPGMGGFGGATLSSAANERFNYAGLPEREKDRQATLRTAQMQADARRYEADAQEQSGLRADATTRRGQDLDLMGRETVARTSLRSIERAAEKDAFDREIKLAEFRANRGDKAFEQKQTRETNLQRNIEAANTTMVDGKPVVNAAAAAEYRRGIDRSVARLGLDGVDKLSPRAEQQLFAASDLLRTMRENASWVPWAPDALKTVDPLDLTDLYVAKNGDRVITREGRAKGQTIPARFFDTEEGNRIRMFGTPTNKYDLLASQTGN